MLQNPCLIIATVSGLIYLAMLCFLVYGWYKLGHEKPSVKTPDSFPLISVIVAVRNEEDSIARLLHSLCQQDYPGHNYEVIIVDDFSTDKTFFVISDYISKHSLDNFICIKNDNTATAGKKGALARAIDIARGEIIIATDADCTMGLKWLGTMGWAINESGYEFVIGPVDIDSRDGIFASLQSLEFMSITGTTGATAAWGLPVMCNGANIAFRKSIYLEVAGCISGKNYPTGDDIFLLMAFKQRRKHKILYLQNNDAIVTTEANNRFMCFLNQRIRWASKSDGRLGWTAITLGAIVAWYNVMIALSAILTFTGLFPGYIPVLLWLLKLFSDFPLLLPVSRFLGKFSLLKYYLPLQIIYPFYVTGVLIGSKFFPYTWKNRKFKPAR